MRPTFLLDLELKLASALVSKDTPHAITTGTMVVLSTAFETPWGVVPTGTKGFVEYVDDIDGMLVVLVEGAEPALYNWGNKLVLIPFDTDDLADCLVCGLRSLRPSTVNASANVTQLRSS